MKSRRSAGATHSFRLTMDAAKIVDDISHPRRLGGKSRKVSEAIEWYFNRPEDDTNIERNVEDLQRSRQWWKERCNVLEESQSVPQVRGLRGIIKRLLRL